MIRMDAGRAHTPALTLDRNAGQSPENFTNVDDRRQIETTKSRTPRSKTAPVHVTSSSMSRPGVVLATGVHPAPGSLSPDEITATFKDRLLEARANSPLSNAEIGRRSQVQRAQVGRILSGKFKTIGANTARVGHVLGVVTEDIIVPSASPVPIWRRVERRLISVWDGTEAGAERILALLDDYASIPGDPWKSRTSRAD